MKVLLAIDASEFSTAATQMIIRQFRPAGTQVRVVHALEFDKVLPAAYDFARGPDYGKDVSSRLKSGKQQAEELTVKTAQQLRSAGFEVTTEVVEGDPKSAILDCAAAWNPDLIVMGSHGRKGWDRFTLGSVSEAVAHNAKCSVEIVRLPPSD